MALDSFYGGQQGKDFKISEIFRNKVEMLEDLKQRWQSSIGVSELVLISYGIPNNDVNEEGIGEYQRNRDLDLSTYGKTYNSTLWQKIYKEENQEEVDELTGIETIYISGEYGLGYRLLASLTGVTPRMGVDDTSVLDCDQPPTVNIVDLTDLDNPILHFSLPQSQVVINENVSTTVINANEKPSTTWNDEGDKVNRPDLTFYLPQSQVIESENVTVNAINADQKAYLTWNDEGDKINRPDLTFYLPQSQVIEKENVSTIVVDANEKPHIEWNDEGDKVNRPDLAFYLPQSQVLHQGDTTILPSVKEPEVILTTDRTEEPGTINTPLLSFSLPRAAKYVYGSLLGESSQGAYDLSLADNPEIAELDLGDFYVNKDVGFIYTVIKKTTDVLTFQFLACLTAPIPKVTTTDNTPYLASGDGYERRSVGITSNYENETEKTGWSLNFDFPRLPNLMMGATTLVGPLENGNAIGTITTEDDYTINFSLPRSSRFFSGSEVVDKADSSVVVAGSKPGDYYLNTNLDSESDGYVYYLDENNKWKFQGSIKGSIGKSFNVIGNLNLAYPDSNEPSVVGPKVEEKFGKINADEIVLVNYVDENSAQISYYYFYVNGEWISAILTGGIGDLFEEQYYENSSSASKGYTTTYINNLISNAEIAEGKDKKTYSARFIDEKLTTLGNLYLPLTGGNVNGATTFLLQNENGKAGFGVVSKEVSDVPTEYAGVMNTFNLISESGATQGIIGLSNNTIQLTSIGTGNSVNSAMTGEDVLSLKLMETSSNRLLSIGKSPLLNETENGIILTQDKNSHAISFKIKGLDEPIENQDAATKSYVDNTVIGYLTFGSF